MDFSASRRAWSHHQAGSIVGPAAAKRVQREGVEVVEAVEAVEAVVADVWRTCVRERGSPHGARDGRTRRSASPSGSDSGWSCRCARTACLGGVRFGSCLSDFVGSLASRG